MYLMEVDRVLRPGGFWIFSGYPINQKTWKRSKEDLKAEQREIEKLAESLCWEKKYEKGDIAIWRKKCTKEAHRPVDCETMSKWIMKNGAESENMNWLCLGAWSDHEENSGGFYACNRYEDAKQEGASRQKALADLQQIPNIHVGGVKNEYTEADLDGICEE